MKNKAVERWCWMPVCVDRRKPVPDSSAATIEEAIFGSALSGATSAVLILPRPQAIRHRGWVFTTTGTAFYPDREVWTQLDDPASNVVRLIMGETEAEETLGWAESCKAAQRIFRRMEDRSREAREREAVLIEDLDLEDVEL